MSIEIPSILFKTRPETLEPPPPETLIDAIRQNALLRWIAVLQASALLSLSLAFLLKSRSGAPSPAWAEPKNVSYGDSVFTDTRTAAGSEAVPPALMAPPVVAPNPTGKERVSEVQGRPPLNPTAITIPQRQSKPSLVAPDLWSLMDDLSKDPRRELLDERFVSEGATITFKEVSPEGLLSFELSNETKESMFLPSLKALNLQNSAYLERRVLDPGSKMEGILRMENLRSIRKMTLEFSAANVKPIHMNLEVPAW